MRLFLNDRPVVRRRVWICLSWFGLEEHDFKRLVKACLVRGIGGMVDFCV